MTYQRLPYEDAATTAEMISDCAAVGVALQLEGEHVGRLVAARPARPGQDEVLVPDSLADLAREMQLHFG